MTIVIIYFCTLVWILTGSEMVIYTRGKLGLSDQMLKTIETTGHSSFWIFLANCLSGPFFWFIHKRQLKRDGGRWELGTITRYEEIIESNDKMIEKHGQDPRLLAMNIECRESIDRLQESIDGK